jgi:hypothetical protein
MNLQRGFRRLVVVLSVVLMAVGVAADALLSPGPSWKVSLSLRDGRKAILRLTWGSDSAHDRSAVAAELTRLMRCPAGRGSELDCLSFAQEALLLPQSVAGPTAMVKRWVRGPDGVIFSVTHARGASREEIIAIAQQQYRPPGRTSAPLPPPPPDAFLKSRDSFVPLGSPEDIVPKITEGDIADMRVVPEWSWRSWPAVEFTAAALALVVLLWLGFFALRWVAWGFVSHG